MVTCCCALVIALQSYHGRNDNQAQQGRWNPLGIPSRRWEGFRISGLYSEGEWIESGLEVILDYDQPT